MHVKLTVTVHNTNFPDTMIKTNTGATIQNNTLIYIAV